MRYDVSTLKRRTGRAATVIADALREGISSGQYKPGAFLPSVRALMASTGSASMTVRRALKLVESEGLARAEKKGYRVLPGGTDPERGCPLAFMVRQELGAATDFLKSLFDSFRVATARRGWSLLSQGTEGLSAEQVVEQLRVARSSGVILDTHDTAMIRAVRESGMTAIMADAWHEDYGLDAVLQDGHLGGVLATRYLAQAGCERIGYFGRIGSDAHARDRFGGVAAGIAAEGPEIRPELFVDPGDNATGAARDYLSRRDRPDGIVSPWTEEALALKRAGDELGLVEGEDYHLVGWCPEELYETHWGGKFGGGRPAPALTWSMHTMAETALARLSERRTNPDLPALRVSVPTRLRLAGE
jgi:hypothetical protein